LTKSINIAYALKLLPKYFRLKMKNFIYLMLFFLTGVQIQIIPQVSSQKYAITALSAGVFAA
jgi:hypothetical protein